VYIIDIKEEFGQIYTNYFITTSPPPSTLLKGKDNKTAQAPKGDIVMESQ
jgi:hypothetical protein